MTDDDDVTTLKVKRDTWKRLNHKKEPGDSFDDVIKRLLTETGDDTGNPKATTAQTAD